VPVCLCSHEFVPQLRRLSGKVSRPLPLAFCVTASFIVTLTVGIRLGLGLGFGWELAELQPNSALYILKARDVNRDACCANV
jgi:hypothetical protein